MNIFQGKNFIDCTELSEAGISEAIDDGSTMSSVVENIPSPTAASTMNAINQEGSEALAESSPLVTFTQIMGTVITQSKCFICESPTGRNITPWPAIQQVWFAKKCYIPKSNRTCKEHLTEWKTFNTDALEKIEATKQGLRVKSSDFELWLNKISDLPKSAQYNFENGSMDPELYKTFCGISKDDFDDLAQYLHGKCHYLFIILKRSPSY